MMEVAVTFPPSQSQKRILDEKMGGDFDLYYLAEGSPEERREWLAASRGMIAWNLPREMEEEEIQNLGHLQWLQLISAGVDHLPFEKLDDSLLIANNAGAYSEPMAEHVLAMTLALAKRLAYFDRHIKEMDFRFGERNLLLKGKVAGILGWGGIGQSCGQLFQSLGMKVYAINRSGQSACEPDFLGTLDDLERVLTSSQVVVLSLPLTRETRHLIGKRELSWMMDDALLINVARGNIIVEKDLYEHLKEHPQFQVGIDAWWKEPFWHGSFELETPLLELPNVLGTPHNSALVEGVMDLALERALENILRSLKSGEWYNIVRREEYL